MLWHANVPHVVILVMLALSCRHTGACRARLRHGPKKRVFTIELCKTNTLVDAHTLGTFIIPAAAPVLYMFFDSWKG